MDHDPQPANPNNLSAGSTPTTDYATPRYSSIVQQVLPFGILLMVNGGLVLLMGAGLGLTAGILIASDAFGEGRQNGAPDPIVIGIVYGVLAAILLVGGILQLFAGWRVTQFRNRVLGFFGIVTAALGVFTCYCGPTGIALAIWGMILLLHADVRYAFQLRNMQTRQEVLNHFSYQGQAWQPSAGNYGPPPGPPPSP